MTPPQFISDLTSINDIASTFLPAGTRCQVSGMLSGGFSSARVYKVDANGTFYVLRETARAAVDSRLVQEQHRWLSRLADQRVPVAEPLVHRVSGTTILLRGESLWQMEPWLPGEPKTGASLTARQLEKGMTTLAKIHRFSQSLPDSATGTPRSLSARLQILSEWTPEALLEGITSLKSAPSELRTILEPFPIHFVEIAGPLKQAMGDLMQEVVPLHWCFRDLWSAHLLYCEDEVSGIIDPHSARIDHVSTDLSRLLGSWFGADRTQWKRGLEIYEKIRPLSETEHLFLRLMDRSSILLSGLTWVNRWRNGEVHLEQLQEILPRLKALRVRLNELVESSEKRLKLF